MVDRTITDLASVEGLGSSPPQLGDLVLGHRNGLPVGFTVGQMGGLAGSAGSVVEGEDVKNAGAKGDGISNDTQAFRSILSGGGVCKVSPGNYLVDTIIFDQNRDTILYGVNKKQCKITLRTDGADGIRCTHTGVKPGSRPGTIAQYEIYGLTIEYAGSTAPANDRCGAEGQAIGNGAIVFDRSNFSTFTSRATGTDNLSWLPLFCNTWDVDIIDRNPTGFGCGILMQGNAYGWRYWGIRTFNTAYGLVVGLPFVRRCTVNGNVVTVIGGNSFRNGHLVRIAGHDCSGAQPSGIGKTQNLTVSNKSGNTFRINDSGSGGSNVYAMVVGGGASEYAPDESSMRNLTHYGGRFAYSTPNAERGTWTGIRSFRCPGGIALGAFTSANRKESDTCRLMGGYFDFRDVAAFPNDDAVLFEADVMNINGLTMTGSRVSGRPKAAFNGADFDIRNFAAISNNGDENGRQPEVRFNATNTLIESSSAHTSAQVTRASSSEVRGDVRRDSGSGFFFTGK